MVLGVYRFLMMNINLCFKQVPTAQPRAPNLCQSRWFQGAESKLIDIEEGGAEGKGIFSHPVPKIRILKWNIPRKHLVFLSLCHLGCQRIFTVSTAMEVNQYLKRRSWKNWPAGKSSLLDQGISAAHQFESLTPQMYKASCSKASAGAAKNTKAWLSIGTYLCSWPLGSCFSSVKTQEIKVKSFTCFVLRTSTYFLCWPC